MEININPSSSWFEQFLIPVASSLIGLIAGYFLNRWSSNSNEKKRLNRVKRIILKDLEEQKRRTDGLVHNLNEFEKRLKDSQQKAQYVTVQNFGTKVFESHHLTDYAEIFSKNDKYLKLLEIYEIIQIIEGSASDKLQFHFQRELEVLHNRYPRGTDRTAADQFNAYNERVDKITEHFITNVEVVKTNINRLKEMIYEFLKEDST